MIVLKEFLKKKNKNYNSVIDTGANKLSISQEIIKDVSNATKINITEKEIRTYAASKKICKEIFDLQFESSCQTSNNEKKLIINFLNK